MGSGLVPHALWSPSPLGRRELRPSRSGRSHRAGASGPALAVHVDVDPGARTLPWDSHPGPRLPGPGLTGRERPWPGSCFRGSLRKARQAAPSDHGPRPSPFPRLLTSPLAWNLLWLPLSRVHPPHAPSRLFPGSHRVPRPAAELSPGFPNHKASCPLGISGQPQAPGSRGDQGSRPPPTHLPSTWSARPPGPSWGPTPITVQNGRDVHLIDVQAGPRVQVALS